MSKNRGLGRAYLQVELAMHCAVIGAYLNMSGCLFCIYWKDLQATRLKFCASETRTQDVPCRQRGEAASRGMRPKAFATPKNSYYRSPVACDPVLEPNTWTPTVCRIFVFFWMASAIDVYFWGPGCYKIRHVQVP